MNKALAAELLGIVVVVQTFVDQLNLHPQGPQSPAVRILQLPLWDRTTTGWDTCRSASVNIGAARVGHRAQSLFQTDAARSALRPSCCLPEIVSITENKSRYHKTQEFDRGFHKEGTAHF